MSWLLPGYFLATKIYNGCGSGNGEDDPAAHGGGGCSVNGDGAVGETGGGGGACLGDSSSPGSGQTEGNSAESGGAGYGGAETADLSCTAGADGKVIVSY